MKVNNKADLKYERYLNADFPITTGFIQGTCCYLVKDRMDITGTQWSLEGAEVVLHLHFIKRLQHRFQSLVNQVLIIYNQHMNHKLTS